MNEPERPKKGWGCLQWFAVLIVLAIIVLLIIPTFGVAHHSAAQATTSNNCRQIIMALRIYANDNGGFYPDAKILNAKTSNEIFQVLIREEIMLDERIFGGKVSPYLPDGNIGEAPDYPKALQSWENHWMMVSGYQTTTPGHFPFVFENAMSPHWPLIWNKDKVVQPTRGRVWRGGKIIVGRADNSVNLETLEKTSSGYQLPETFRNPLGKEPVPKLSILDIQDDKPPPEPDLTPALPALPAK